MSQISVPNAKLSADDRYELAAKAQHQHRLNYPSHLIVLGLLMVFVSIVAVAIAWQVRSAAQKSNRLKTNEIVQVEEIITQINTLKLSQANSSTKDQFAPIPDMLSKFKRYAVQAKLEHELGIPKNQGSRPEGNARRMTYPYTVRDPSLEHLLEWVKISLDQIPGLEVTDLKIMPSKLDWTLTVTLARYERIE